MAAKKSTQILCTGEKQFLTGVLKSKAFPRLRNEERVKGQKIPNVNGVNKIIRALPIHRNNESLLQKYSLLHTESLKIILKYSKVNRSKRLLIHNLRYLEPYYKSLKSFQRVFLRRQLEPNYVFNCQISYLRMLPVHTPDVSKENQHFFYSRNLRSGIMDRRSFRKVFTLQNCPFRDIRLNILQSDLENNLQSSHMNNFSRLFRKMKRLDHVRESRSVTYTSIGKLSGLNTLPVQNRVPKHNSYGDVTTMNDGLRLDAENSKIMKILNIHRHYTRYNSNSLVGTYFEGRLISPHSAYYQLFIPTYNRYLNYQLNNNLQYINCESNYTLLQSDLIKRTLSVRNAVKKRISETLQLFNRNCEPNNLWSFMRKQVFQGQFIYMGKREAKIDILRLDLYNRRKGEHWRTDTQNDKIANRLGSEEKFGAKDRFEFETRTNFLPKYVNYKIHQHSVTLQSSENNCEKMHRENIQRTSRNDFSSKNSRQKEIVCEKRMLKNCRQNFRSIEKNRVLIGYERINVNQEHGWKNYIGSIFQLHRLTYKPKGAQNNELENIDRMYPKIGNNTINICGACNELLQHLILITLYTLHASFIYGGNDKF